MLNDWAHKVRAIFKKILPSSQSAWNTRFYFGHQKLCMDNNLFDWSVPLEFCSSFITWNLLSATSSASSRNVLFVICFSNRWMFPIRTTTLQGLVAFSVGLLGRLYTYYLTKSKTRQVDGRWVAEISGLFVAPSLHSWDIILYCKKELARFFFKLRLVPLNSA